MLQGRILPLSSISSVSSSSSVLRFNRFPRLFLRAYSAASVWFHSIGLCPMLQSISPTGFNKSKGLDTFNCPLTLLTDYRIPTTCFRFPGFTGFSPSSISSFPHFRIFAFPSASTPLFSASALQQLQLQTDSPSLQKTNMNRAPAPHTTSESTQITFHQRSRSQVEHDSYLQNQ